MTRSPRTYLLTFGIQAVAGQLSSDDSTLKRVGSLVGTTVSGVFLIIIGVINLVVLVGIIKVFRRMRSGSSTRPSSRTSSTTAAS